jgi:hypothetical protein
LVLSRCGVEIICSSKIVNWLTVCQTKRKSMVAWWHWWCAGNKLHEHLA